MTFDHLIFVGLNGYAAALDRDTGEVVWRNDQMKSSYVTMFARRRPARGQATAATAAPS